MAHRAVTSRDARFQQWQALLGNRTKRTRSGLFVVQGVRPITLAVRHGWRFAALLRPYGRRLSGWAADLVARCPATELVEVAPELLAELGGKDEPPELVAIAHQQPDRLDRLPAGPDLLAVVFDRAASPGNIGTLTRSADGFGATGVIVTGHAADPYEPRAVRASTGSLFALPVVRAERRDVLAWVARLRAGGLPVRLVGTDETGAVELPAADLTGPTVLVVGNETSGLSSAWREACDAMVRIPMGGSASSLNAAVAGSLVLYHAAGQRAPR
ncbi:rRNA methyltransferase [Actinocatenispora thailandica]|uniref:rRNA methyltransferase n=1 Tax=Actinocatenispora thailandica TaxID=227318 RepID=A0A7R7HWK9_9ACTN|nr:TrmH family RNA methyltransferase [Actinocatenispora thailandica]BCJ35197.1 rRNA methyltransferase [Actinocatenispora thailandica]